MTLVDGTNCGFVTVAPTADPSAGSTILFDNNEIATRHTSPVGAQYISEIGVYIPDATDDAGMEVGIYDNGDGTTPGTLLGMATLTKGITAGWKKATVSIYISPSTSYFLAAQLDNTVTATDVSRELEASHRYARQNSATALTNPWGANDSGGTYMIAIYALVSAPPATGQMRLGKYW
jgi:hypothetical protein